MCSLTLVGFGNRTGIKSASLSCTGGTIKVAPHKELQNYWGQNKALPGVVWESGSDCVTNTECLLTVCDRSNAVFNAASVTSLKGGSGKPAWRLAVCVTTGSTVTFRKSSFTIIQGATPLAIHSNTTSVLVEQCTIQGNSGALYYSSAIRVDNAHVAVLSSTVADNNASGTPSGPITAAATAQINIQRSSFYRNAAANGGAVHAKERAMVTIQGSRFEGNSASARGGAIYATDQSQVQVLANRLGEGVC